MKIIGEKKPIVGVTEMYSVIDSDGVLFTNNTNNVTYAWYIFKKYKNGAFVNVTKNNVPKIGQTVPYSLGYNVEYRLDVYKLEKELLSQKDKASFVASYFVTPTKKGSKSEIKKVVLYNKGAKNVDLAGIGNSLTVRVECINMINKQVKVHVWNVENKSESNFINADIKSEPNLMNSRLIDINEKGIGLTQFNVMQLLSPTDSMDLMIGNKKAIGFYVTATYEEQSVTNKTAVVVVSQYQSIADIFENARSMSSYNDIETPAPEKPKEKKCFCNRDFKESDVKELVKFLKGREAIWEGYKNAPCTIDDKSFATLTKELNAMFKKYKINHCAQKLHFLAQACHETDTFTLSEETKSNHASSQSIYKGRGILQLTGVRKNGENYYDLPGPYETYSDYIGINAIRKPQIIAEQIKYCLDSGGWMFSVFKKMPNAPSQAVDRWGIETAGKSLNELALDGDKYLELISALLNGRPKPEAMPNGWNKRKMNYDLLKTGFFNYDFFHNNAKQKTEVTDDVVTYHIYANGEIERHIPKTIKSGYEDKYKYVYHDKDDKKYTICTVKWHATGRKETGKNEGKVMPTHSKIISDEKVSEGQTTRRVIYENGDVAEYGYNKGIYFWNLYKSLKGKIELVKMPNELNYNYSGVVVKYSFSNTQRRYTSPNALAGFIGALAETGFTNIITTGSCFAEGTCFPSVAHVNGKSIDTLYIDRANQTEFITAMNKFGFNDQITGNDGTHTYKGTKNKSDHNDHLHSGFDESKIKLIKQ